LKTRFWITLNHHLLLALIYKGTTIIITVIMIHLNYIINNLLYMLHVTCYCSEERRERAQICYQSLRQSKNMLQTKVQDHSVPGQSEKIRRILIDMSHF